MMKNPYFTQNLATLLIRHAMAAPPPHEAHARLAAHYDASFILESREGPKQMSRYSFVSANPAGIVTCRTELTATGALPAPSADQSPIEYLRRVQAFYHVDDHASPFIGGLVGSFGFDFVRELEPSLAGPEESWPRFQLGLYLDALVYDHHEDSVTYVSRGEDRSAEWASILATAPKSAGLKVGSLQEHVSDVQFKERVTRAQELIRAGENFQIVLSRPFTAPFSGQCVELYPSLREQHAVPYLYHVRFAGRELVGASPEMLVRVRNRIVETFPIAGTRPITGDSHADAAAAKDLLADPKETAEHAMLVDLARNDVARSSNNVQVAEYQEIKQFRHVQHIVSRVIGELRPENDALDAFAAVFPAGTVSGAPKIRALEHIDALETSPRGPYAGAVAYLSFNGDLDSAITIRSISAQNGSLTVQAGAGIVLGSNPQAEANETRQKAEGMLRALQPFQENP
jgi:anthranilate synthase component 1